MCFFNNEQENMTAMKIKEWLETYLFGVVRGYISTRLVGLINLNQGHYM